MPLIFKLDKNILPFEIIVAPAKVISYENSSASEKHLLYECSPFCILEYEFPDIDGQSGQHRL